MIDDISKDLQAYFGFSKFRPGQVEAIQSLLDGQHTLVVMPTGSGKSLIYQFTAMHLPGITLVISPLIALMKDQVDSLARRNISATFINSSLANNEQNQRLIGVSAGQYRLLYIAPERLRSDQFMSALQNQQVSLLAVDEAHCISEWGHDFRPDYLHLAQFRTALGNPLIVALTATATPQVQNDIIRLLGLTEAQRIVTGFNRPNLKFVVQTITSLPDKLKTLQQLLCGDNGSPAIIYTGTRRDAEEVAEFTSTVIGIKTRHYHAGLTVEERTYIQNIFMAGDLPLVASTNAFGMGIDRPDVRQVIHYSLPGSIEAYYQEAGRAGRDGLPANAVLLYSSEDRALQEWFIANSVVTVEDLRVLFDSIEHAIQWQNTTTIDDISVLTGLPEIKVRVGLSELERAGLIEHLGDQGLRMRLRLNDWKTSDVIAMTDKLKLHQEHRKKQLSSMISYAETNACRRLVLLKYFGDPGSIEAEDCCDNCSVKVSTPATSNNDVSTLSQAERASLIVLDTVRRLKQGVGRGKIAQILRGSKAQDILRYGYSSNIYYGKLAVFRQAELEEMIDQLLEMGYLKAIGGKYPVLRLTPKGEIAIHNKIAILLNMQGKSLARSFGIKKIEQPVRKKNNITDIILNCVKALPGELPRSGIAKLLVGSDSERVGRFRSHAFFNRLAGYHRHEVLKEVDRLLNDDLLAQDKAGYIIPGKTSNTNPIPIDIDIKYVVALGDSKESSAVTELVGYLRNPNGNIRRLAASALGKIQDKRAVKPLIKMLENEEKPQVRQYAVKALGKIGDASAIPLLESITKEYQEKEYTRVAAKNAIVSIKSLQIPRPSTEDKVFQAPDQSAEDDVSAFLSRPHPRQLPGPWRAGWALGFHSQFQGANWNRSGIGELAYRLKYQGDLSVLPALVDQAAILIADHPDLAQVDAIVPVPPSTPRPHDPVSSFAQVLAERFGLALLPIVVKVKQTSPQKELHALAQKRANVAGAFGLESSVKGKRLLVVDDLFDSGATLEEINRLLRRHGAIQVCVLTLTRTIHSDA